MNPYVVERLAEQHYQDLVALAQLSARPRRRSRRTGRNPVAVLVAAFRLLHLPARLGTQTRNCAS